MINNKIGKPIMDFDDRALSIIVFSFIFSWLLAFPFEGQVLYVLAYEHKVNLQNVIFASIIAHFLGLLSSGFFIKNTKCVKKIMLFTIIFCMTGTFAFLFPPSNLWYIILICSSFFMGCCVAAWGYYFKKYTPANERIKTVADSLIYSNVLMITINITAIKVSVDAGIILSIIILGIGVIFVLKLQDGDSEEVNNVEIIQSNYKTSINKALAFLCLFIIIITVNSGLMYRVVNPAFVHLEWLASWYWAVPYITAIFIMKNVPRTINRSYILYVAIAMIGFAFIAFMTLDNSALSYLVIDTLMLGAFGVYDLFWWSILGEMLEFHDNPAKIMGVGLSSNVLGVLIGGLLGNSLINTNYVNNNTSIVALIIIFIILIILPVLHKQLLLLLKNHAYLIKLSEMTSEEQISAKKRVAYFGNLTERESEIVGLLLKGRTYKMVAEELFLSENTVKTHIKNVYSKLNISSKAELIKLLANEKPIKS